jgi:hypothetical protein
VEPIPRLKKYGVPQNCLDGPANSRAAISAPSTRRPDERQDLIVDTIELSSSCFGQIDSESIAQQPDQDVRSILL